MARYNGKNQEGFDREARQLFEFFSDKPVGYRDLDYNKSIEDYAHDLADAFSTGRAEIWDYLAEYGTVTDIAKGE